MSVAWATFVAVILLLLPGVAFLFGLATPERYSREIVRASAVNEIALAIAVALLLHLLLLVFLVKVAGLDVERFVRPIVDIPSMRHDWAVHFAVKRLSRAVAYVL